MVELLTPRKTRTTSLLQDLLVPLDVTYDLDQQQGRIDRLNTLYGDICSSSTYRDTMAAYVRDDFWAFVALCAWTEDEKDRRLPIKPIAPYPYVKAIADFGAAMNPDGSWENDIIACVKSRQMMMSWIAVLFMVWLTVCHPSVRCLIVSKNEDHGVVLLARAKIVYRCLPTWVLSAFRMPDDADKIFGVKQADFPNGSQIKALPEKGGDAVRSYSATFTFLDEAGYQGDLERTWTSVMGGRAKSRGRSAVWAVCTAVATNTLQFRDLIEDRKDTGMGVQMGGIAQMLLNEEGLQIHKSKLYGINIIRLHYLADPSMREPGAVARAMVGFDQRKWRQEMELDFYALSGQPLFPMFDPAYHVMKTRPELQRNSAGKGWSIRVPNAMNPEKSYLSPCVMGLGIDHGRRNPCGSLLMAADKENDLFAVWDYAISGRSATENAWAIRRALGDRYNGCMFQTIDAMHALADRREGMIEDLYRYEWLVEQDGRHVQSTPILPFLETCKKWAGSVQEGIDQISDMLHASLAVRTCRGKQMHPYWEANGYDEAAVNEWAKRRSLFISPDCTALVQELQLGRYKDHANATINQPEGEVDAHNHVRKALTYLLAHGIRFG